MNKASTCDNTLDMQMQQIFPASILSIHSLGEVYLFLSPHLLNPPQLRQCVAQEQSSGSFSTQTLCLENPLPISVTLISSVSQSTFLCVFFFFPCKEPF